MLHNLAVVIPIIIPKIIIKISDILINDTIVA